MKAKVQFEREIAELLEDCDDYEIRVIKDVLQATKQALRKDAWLRKQVHSDK